MINTFLITGATQGLGRSIALHLAGLKYHVYAVGRTSELLESLSKENPFIHPICADITNSNDREKILLAVSKEKNFSIIHNAAITAPKLFVDDENNEFLRKQFETNFFAPLHLTKKLLPFLENGQRVLHISSGAANLELPGLMGYCVSKSALEHAVRCLNKELAGKIYFASLHPGMIDTPMQNQLRRSSIADLPGKDFYVKSFEEKKLQPPEEVAEFVGWVMLETDDETYVSKIWDVDDIIGQL